MDECDLQVRNAPYALLVELGRPPTVAEVAEPLSMSRVAIEEAWRRLHDERALVLNPATTDLRMLIPFSAVPTAYRVHADGRWCITLQAKTMSSPGTRRRAAVGARSH